MNAEREREKPRAALPLPVPRALGIFALLLAALSGLAGRARSETALYLIAFMLFACLAYSFFAVLVLVLVYRGAARRLRARIAADKIVAGAEAHLSLEYDAPFPGARSPRFFQAPAVIIRYKLKLATKDDKRIELYFSRSFLTRRQGVFTVPLRGAYFGRYDELIIRDIFGFFRAVFRVPHSSASRVRAAPALSAAEAARIPRSGGSEQRDEGRITRTDDLVEQRPYTPGDDPRRINWKLYGHAGDLFVREEDREPPPRARFVLLLATEAAPSLFRSPPAAYGQARRGAAEVDLLCEAALVLAADCAAFGVEMVIGFSGGELFAGGVRETAEALAFPWAAADGEGALPRADGEKELTILALPCVGAGKGPGKGSGSGSGSLDRFLAEKPAAQRVHLLFCYGDERLFGPAEASAHVYGRQEGVYARAFRL